MTKFHRFLAARLVAAVGGGAIEALGPIVAAAFLGASAAQMGLITATTLIVSAAATLPVAAWADRPRDEIRYLIVFTVGGALVSAGVPLLWLADRLTFPLYLLLVAVDVVFATLVASIGHVVVNELVPRAERVTAVGRLRSASSAGDIVGHSGGAGLIALMAAPLSFLSDTFLGLLSAALLVGLRRSRTNAAVAEAAPAAGPAQPPNRHPSVDSASVETDSATVEPAPIEPVRQTDQPPPATVWTVLANLLHRGDLWILWAAGFVGSLVQPVTVLYILHHVHIPASAIGVITAMGAIGGLSAGLVVGAFIGRLGYRSTVCAGLACMLAVILPVPLLAAASPVSYVLLVMFEVGTAFGGTILLASVYGTLQTRTARHVISRTMSSAGFIMQGVALAGIGCGVLLAGALAYRSVFVVTAAAYALLLVASVIWAAGTRRTPPTIEPGQDRYTDAPHPANAPPIRQAG